MGSKRRCPACGAKNELTVRRCRVCTAIVNPDVPEGGPAVEEPAARSALDDHFDSGVIDRQMQSARSKFGSGSGALAARLAAANGGEMPASYTLTPAAAGLAPSAPPPDAPATSIPSHPEPEPSYGAPASSYPPAEPVEEEPFDPDALFRDMG